MYTKKSPLLYTKSDVSINSAIFMDNQVYMTNSRGSREDKVKWDSKSYKMEWLVSYA